MYDAFAREAVLVTSSVERTAPSRDETASPCQGAPRGSIAKVIDETYAVYIYTGRSVATLGTIAFQDPVISTYYATIRLPSLITNKQTKGKQRSALKGAPQVRVNKTRQCTRTRTIVPRYEHKT